MRAIPPIAKPTGQIQFRQAGLWLAPLLCWLLLVQTGPRATGEEHSPEFLSKIVRPDPFPSLVASAARNQIPLDGMDAVEPADHLRVGDTLTALLTLRQKGSAALQWAIQVIAMDPNSAETRQQARHHSPLRMYSSLGTRLEFASAPVPVTIRTFGPFSEAGQTRPPKVEEKLVRSTLDEGFLKLGLDQAARAVIRFRSEAKTRGFLSFQSNPPKAEDAAKARKVAETLHLTATEERALGGSFPALTSYVGIVQQTPGLQDILVKVVDLPSVWSLVKNLGVKDVNVEVQSLGMGEANVADWRLAESGPAYHVPMELHMNRQLALKITLLALSPSSPLLPCAGVAGLLAEHPRDKETFLTIHIVSAHRGKG